MRVHCGRLLFWVTAIGALAADQLSKQWVVAALPFQQTVFPSPSWLHSILVLTYTTNKGVAFGLFPQLSALLPPFIALVAVGLIYLHHTLEHESVLTYLAMGLVTGGAMGNLIDRLARGAVVDFIDLEFWPLREWPIFNLADSFILVGTTLFVLLSLLADERRAPELEAEETSDA